jgi:hypothetical protein
MSKVIVAQNGVVINIVNYVEDDPAQTVYNLLVDDTYVVNVGDAFDPKDWQINPNTQWTQADYVSGQILFNHENRIRTLEGKTAITVKQFKTAVKALLP